MIGMNYVDLGSQLNSLGQNIGNTIEDRRLRNALGNLPPEASLTDRANAIWGINPKLAAELSQRGQALDIARERNTLYGAGGNKPMSQYQQFQVDRANRQDAQKKVAADSKIDVFVNNSDDLATYAEDLAKHPGLEGATGSFKPRKGTWAAELPKEVTDYIPAESIPNKPGGDVANFEAAKKTLKAKIGFTELQAMRNASTTGGALGQVAVQEIDYLQNSIEAIDGIQDPEVLRQSFKDIAAHYRKLGNIMRAMKSQGWQPPSEEPNASDASSLAPGTVVDGYTYKGGDPNDRNSWEAPQ